MLKSWKYKRQNVTFKEVHMFTINWKIVGVYVLMMLLGAGILWANIVLWPM